MFYYYQIRTHHHQTEHVPHVVCPVCHTAGHLQMSIMQKYMWMLGPVFPYAKHAVAFCEHCNNYIPKVRWTDEMDSAFQELKQGLKTPGRLYRGLLVFPLAIVLVIGAVMLFVKTKANKQQNNQALIKEAIAHPRKGDIFQITHSDGTNTYYTYFRVAGSQGDSVYFNPSKVRITDVKNMKEWDQIPVESNAYETDVLGFSISGSKESDMFKYKDQVSEYGIVWSLYRDGTLYKKY
jgi:hypothetical protein